MNTAATVEGGERLRLFFGLPIPDAALDRLVGWQRQTFAGMSRVRPVPAEHLHVTLAFLGGRPRAELPALLEALAEAVVGCAPPVLEPERYRETDRVAMLVLADEEGRGGALQERLAQSLERIGAYRRERRPWLAHVSVARFAARPRLLPTLPDLGPFSPSDAALYHSVLRPDGAQYRIVEAVVLGG